MSQTFAQLKARLHRGVLRDDLVEDYGSFLNEGLREIQNRRSWTSMKRESDDLTIPTGSGRETVALPADFKELQKDPAVAFVTEDGGWVPAEVVTEEQQIYRLWIFGGTPICTWPPRLFIERRATETVLGVLEALSQPLAIRVKYYAYLPDLSADTDTSALADLYPNMVLAKARAIALSQINDREADNAELEFEKKLADAIRQDAYSEVVGRVNRM